MLIRYSVENFMSINERQIFSMAASQGTRHKDHLINLKDHKLLKCGLIFGANASGKSNLIKSLDFSLNIILNGLEKADVNNKYFKINTANYRKPGIFQYDLAINNDIFTYGFAISYDQKKIVSEWLFFGSNQDVCIFERNLKDLSYVIKSDVKMKEDDSTRFKIYCEDYKDASKAISQKLFLSDIALRSPNDSDYFGKYIEVFRNLSNTLILFPASRYTKLGNVAKNQSLKQLFEKFLSCFDTGIDSVENEKIEFDKFFGDGDYERTEKIKQDISNRLRHNKILNIRLGDTVISLSLDDNGKILASKMLLDHGCKENLFECSEESDGTQRLFDLIPLFFQENNNKLIVIDEIDRSLHNKLSRKFLELYFELTKNNNSQIIATTHETSLLDLNLLRQDEIWFIERDKNHSSKLYSLNKFKERYDKDAEKEYLLGKYGAIPLFTKFSSEDSNE